MKSKKKVLFLLGIIFLFYGLSFAGKDKTVFKYHSPKETNRVLKNFIKVNKKISRLHKLSVSRSGEEVNLIEIGNEISYKKKKNPAVLVVANLEGVNPLATEAALYLSELLINNPEAWKKRTWYIMPVGNPDAAQRYFSKPLYVNRRNYKPVNDDNDDQIDEDGFEDLDKNGFITQMRVKDPKGMWIPIPGEPRLMKKADWKKGEKGIYKLYTEGIDNDKDGKYNEDGKGGVNLAKQFPHLFKHFKKDGGEWAGSEETIFNLFKFVFSHDEIAMTVNFSNTNFLLQPPQGGRKSKADYNNIKIPERIGKVMGFDSTRTYTMKEIMEKAKDMVPPGITLTESMVAGFLGLGAVVNPIKTDLSFYEIISKEYKKYLEERKFKPERFDPKKAIDGSFELWAYYHLGLPSFSMDFWTISKLKKKSKKTPGITAEKLEKMTKEEFLALGKEKIQAFLKSSGAPKNIKAEMVIQGVKSGMMTPKRMAGMLKKMLKSKKSKDGIDPFDKAFLDYNDKELKGKGFINWKPYNHPTLGKVEIGGKVPFASTIPKENKIEELLKNQVPYILKLTEKLPSIVINKIKTKDLGSGIYSIQTWVENIGVIPYPTAIGERNGRITPVIVSIKGKGIKILEGKKRALIRNIRGLQKKMIKWLIFSDKPVTLNIKSFTKMAGIDSRTIKIGGKK